MEHAMCGHGVWGERVTVDVPEEVGEVEELWDELLHVSARFVDGGPGAGDAEKLPVRVVESGGGDHVRVT